MLNALIASGHGAAPDLIYARGIPDNPRPAPGSFDPIKSCTLLLVEIGFCRDLGCREKLEEKTRKYQPLLRALEQIWGAVSLVCIPIGHAGTTLECTVEDLSNALSRIRPPLAAARRDKGHPEPDYDMKAKHHARLLVRRLMDDLCHLSQSRLLSIIANRRKEVANLDPANRTSPPFSQHPRVHKLASGPIK